MDNYDPLKDPDPEEWLAEDEGMRRILVEDYHKQAKIHVPGMYAHTLFHTVVENQVALGSECRAGATLQRLLREGLDRHEAIHAIASEFMTLIFDARKRKIKCDINVLYNMRLDKFTAKKWLRSGSNKGALPDREGGPAGQGLDDFKRFAEELLRGKRHSRHPGSIQ